MKLVIAVVQGSDAEDVLEGLMDAGFRATQINSSGGFLRISNVTFLIGVEESQVSQVAEIVDRHTTSRRSFVNPLMPFAQVNFDADEDQSDSVRVGASIFVVNVRRFERLTG